MAEILITYDGQKFPFVPETSKLTYDELDVIEAHYEQDITEIFTAARRREVVKILVWASIARGRPGFTLAEAGALPVDEGLTAFHAAQRPASPVAEGSELLSPTSAGRPRTRRPASPKSAAGAATTPRRSRSTSGSGRGKSGA